MAALVPRVREGQFLGRGASKDVVATTRNGALVAVMTSSRHDLAREAELMKRLSRSPHPHLLSLLDVEYDASCRVALVAPIAVFGSMHDLADHLEFEDMALSLADTSVATLQVADALLHLSKLGVEHGDVSARNVLVRNYSPGAATGMRVCLADFGEARVTESGRGSPVSVMSLARELHALVPAN